MESSHQPQPQSKTQQVTDAVGAIASLIPYVGQVAALAPAITTLIGFVNQTIDNYRHQGEMTDAERDSFKMDLADLKRDPGWQTDAERSQA